MSTYPAEEGKRLGITATFFPNKFFDPVEGTRLYEERMTEYLWAEEVGVDGIMLNEHHNAPFTMQSKINIFAAALAAMTKRVKLVLLGNPLPLADNPVRIAEELAMIDCISKGRLISGIVRGAGQEQIATNANPAFNRERFEEAHDLLIKTWTEPGPWRWEGTHYQFRVVNPWVLPLQQPHPRIWVPGVVSRETIEWTARHRYPYIALNTTIEATKAIWAVYDETAKEAGYESGPEQRGYLIRCHVQDTEEKALRNAKEFMWMAGEFLGLSHPVWANPSGYGSPLTRRQRLQSGPRRRPNFDEQIAAGQIIAGTPDQVVKKLRPILEETRPSILALWGNDGAIDHKDSMNCIKLLGQEVMPAIREIGKELGLNSPIDSNTPVSVTHGPPALAKPRS
ncbi:MAG: LLM class flavin-dependent oxidoreductase [Chloroflexi bacterium]|nr:LLM class flavin-dependent oxidoreductase [Chloroflexota bacterium]